MIVFYSQNIDETTGILHENEAWHCTQVLRKRMNDQITVLDGLGNKYDCMIRSFTKAEVHFDIVKIIREKPISYLPIVAISLLKNTSRFEWFLEKICEIGVKRIQPIICQRTEKLKLRMDRAHTILISSMKQSMRSYLPELKEPMPFGCIIDQVTENHKFICHFDQGNPYLFHTLDKGKPAFLLIGPEGDFTDNELKMAITKGYQPINISKVRLRTETAGIVAAQTIAARNV